jgi:hypothetical protein
MSAWTQTHVDPVGGAELRGEGLEAVLAAGDQHEVALVVAGDDARHLQPEARRGAGDQGVLPSERQVCMAMAD